MRRKPAPGSQDMQDALKDPSVHKIVDILLQIIGQDYFKRVALFLRNNDQRTSPTFAQKLQALRMHPNRPDANGRYITPPYIDELVLTIDSLYRQDQKKIDFQRGAIVELLTSELVCPRCKNNECLSNQSFIYRRGESNQVDVTILSEYRHQIEGYTCKTKRDWLKSEDCTNLTELARKAQEEDYDVHIGVICFDNSSAITQRVEYLLEGIPSTKPIYAYGLDNIQDLRKSPF
jgi:hypothetical protein